MPQITVYTRDTCAPCKTVKMYLTRHGLAFTERSVDDNPGLMDEIINRTGFMQVPMIDIDGLAISGANFGAIARALDN